MSQRRSTPHRHPALRGLRLWGLVAALAILPGTVVDLHLLDLVEGLGAGHGDSDHAASHLDLHRSSRFETAGALLRVAESHPEQPLHAEGTHLRRVERCPVCLLRDGLRVRLAAPGIAAAPPPAAASLASETRKLPLAGAVPSGSPRAPPPSA